MQLDIQETSKNITIKLKASGLDIPKTSYKGLNTRGWIETKLIAKND
jgi:hypothetical protein